VSRTSAPGQKLCCKIIFSVCSSHKIRSTYVRNCGPWTEVNGKSWV
jgi:hypothetical protein